MPTGQKCFTIPYSLGQCKQWCPEIEAIIQFKVSSHFFSRRAYIFSFKTWGCRMVPNFSVNSSFFCFTVSTNCCSAVIWCIYQFTSQMGASGPWAHSPPLNLAGWQEGRNSRGGCHQAGQIRESGQVWIGMDTSWGLASSHFAPRRRRSRARGGQCQLGGWAGEEGGEG